MTGSDFDGLTAIVTGAASGIGLATAELLRARGARVGVLDRHDGPAGYPYAAADIADDASVVAAMASLIGELGRLDILVNNAGIGAVGDIAANPDEDWRAVLDVNVIGLVRVTRAALSALRRSEQASITNVCSVAATVGMPRRALYSASKGAVLSLTRAMAADLVADGVRVNAVNPGTVDTPWVDRLLQASTDQAAERDNLRGRQPHGRLVTAAEVAAAICYLAGPAAGSTNGAILAVDGGLAGFNLGGPRAGH